MNHTNQLSTIGGIKSCEPQVGRPNRPYEDAADHLNNSIGLLRNSVEELERRLEPVLTPLNSDQAGNEKKPVPLYAPITAALHDRADEVAHLGIRVQALLNRLEV